MLSEIQICIDSYDKMTKKNHSYIWAKSLVHAIVHNRVPNPEKKQLIAYCDKTYDRGI